MDNIVTDVHLLIQQYGLLEVLEELEYDCNMEAELHPCRCYRSAANLLLDAAVDLAEHKHCREEKG